MTVSLHDRIRGCLAGVAVGDALGMPWETCKRADILSMTGGTGVTTLQDLPADHPRKVADTRGILLGETTDDWQLTRAVAVSLIRSKNFHIFDQVAAHIEAYETSIKGWGGSTRNAMASMKRWFDTRGREGRRPDLPAPPEPGRGKGNGVVMKLAPLACMAALSRSATREETLRQSITALGRMSHQEEVSGDVGAVMLALLENRLDLASPDALIEMIYDPALKATLRGLFLDGTTARRPSTDEIWSTCGTTFLASESAALCLALLLRHPGDAEQAMLEAINGGGDTDTNAAITGALLGAHLGLAGLPEAWRGAIPDATQAVALAEKLIEAFSGPPSL